MKLTKVMYEEYGGVRGNLLTWEGPSRHVEYQELGIVLWMSTREVEVDAQDLPNEYTEDQPWPTVTWPVNTRFVPWHRVCRIDHIDTEYAMPELYNTSTDVTPRASGDVYDGAGYAYDE